MLNSVFINLPIENLARSMEFFGNLGFKFNEQFTDERSTCMIVNEHIFVMLVEHEKFKGFIKTEIAARNTTEAILSFSCDSVAEVKGLAQMAFDNGAKQVNEFEDIGFMASWGFEDLDGHLWDLFWMDPEHVM